MAAVSSENKELKKQLGSIKETHEIDIEKLKRELKEQHDEEIKQIQVKFEAQEALEDAAAGNSIKQCEAAMIAAAAARIA